MIKLWLAPGKEAMPIPICWRYHLSSIELWSAHSGQEPTLCKLTSKSARQLPKKLFLVLPGQSNHTVSELSAEAVSL